MREDRKEHMDIPEWVKPAEAYIRDIIKSSDSTAAVERLRHFDMRDMVFRQAAVENRGTLKGLAEDFQRYCASGVNGAAVRTAIGKVWSEPCGYDYDASLYANYIFWKTLFSNEQTCPIEHLSGYQYVIRSDGAIYRGDTMNSWATTLHEFFRLFGGGEGGYLKGMVRNECPGVNQGKWRLPQGGPEWAGFLSRSKHYQRALPSYITEFLDVVYTPGNFIPIPAGCNVYTLKDYFDLKLFCIYNWYQDRFDAHIMEIVNDSKCRSTTQSRLSDYKRWLERFGDWDAFVSAHDLQPFVAKSGSHFGRPRELWDGHFESCFELPRTEGEFEQFFVNARIRILARGKLIAERLLEYLEQND